MVADAAESEYRGYACSMFSSSMDWSLSLSIATYPIYDGYATISWIDCVAQRRRNWFHDSLFTDELAREHESILMSSFDREKDPESICFTGLAKVCVFWCRKIAKLKGED